MKVKIDLSESSAKGGKLRSDPDARLGRDGFFQNHANLRLGAACVVRRAQLECAMNLCG